jgi:transcriptional regulator with XRE-family HTH domain
MASMNLIGAYMADSKTPKEIEAEFGVQLRDLRLRKNIDQKQLAELAGVGLNAVKNLEGGKGATVLSLVKVLRALGRIEWLSTLAPTVSISPLQMMKKSSPRLRAYKIGRAPRTPRKIV